MTPDTTQATAWYRQIHWQILVALALGVSIGGVCYYTGYRFDGPSPIWIDGELRFVEPGHSIFWYPGQLFLRLLKMIVLPLIVASVIVGVSSLDKERLGRVGLKTMLYYLGTTASAVVLGMVVVNLIRPGSGAGHLEGSGAPAMRPKPIDEILMDIVPKNVFGEIVSSPPGVLPVIFFCILFGLALAHGGAGAEPVRKFFVSLNETIMRVTMWVMALAPIGVFGLIADTVVTTGFDDFDELALYMVTVLVGLTIHAVFVLPLLLWLFSRRRPTEYAKALSPALMTAFSTASSSATLPVTIQSAEERAGVSRNISEFVLPLGATVNMDGTALYEAVAVMFIAQAVGIDLSLGAQLLVVLTATMAAIGAAGVPSAGLVTMILVLEAVGLPLDKIGLILAVDRILDMCRTTVNVWGDAIGAAIIAAKEPQSEGG